MTVEMLQLFLLLERVLPPALKTLDELKRQEAFRPWTVENEDLRLQMQVAFEKVREVRHREFRDSVPFECPECGNVSIMHRLPRRQDDAPARTWVLETHSWDGFAEHICPASGRRVPEVTA